MQWVSCTSAYTRYVKQIFRDLSAQPGAEAKAKMQQLQEDFMFPLDPEVGKEQ